MKKYRLNINNIPSLAVAQKIEDALERDKRIKNVVVNYKTSKVSFEADKITIKELNDIITKVEYNVYVGKKQFKNKIDFHLAHLILGGILGIVGIHGNLPHGLSVTFVVLGYILLLYRTVELSIKLLISSHIIDENALITIACIGAFCIGDWGEGLAVIALYTVSKVWQQDALNHSRKSINAIIDLKQDYVNRKNGTKLEKVKIEDVNIDDILLIKNGEKIQVDSEIIKGETLIDSSFLTGETELVSQSKGDIVLSGSVNRGDIIEVKVVSLYKDSIVSRIIEMIEESTNKKTKSEMAVTKLGRIYSPTVLLLAGVLILIVPLFTKLTYLECLKRSMTFLVLCCPCALAITIPLSYFVAIAVSSRNGVLVKGSNYLDRIKQITKIIFDKTGTLTLGSFTVTNIEIFDNKYTRDEVVGYLVKGESLSNHPIAKSILRLTDKEIDSSAIEDYKEVPGKGIKYTLNGKKVMIGNDSLCRCGNEAFLHLNVDGKHIASISIEDDLKDSAYDCISELKKKNIHTYMFTGDKEREAEDVGRRLGLDSVRAEMLPTEKCEEYDDIVGADYAAFVGDGINDAPVLRKASIGISMGNIGSESAIEASDVVIITDDLTKIPLLIDISKYTDFIIKENIIGAFIFKVAFLGLVFSGYISMWHCIFIDSFITLGAIFNALRINKKFKTEKEKKL